ncbi:MAG: hypothetical protein IJQ21_12290 [Lachnospiraceae bacterium]|nr:hypothetical protein [Lachnospiraceae bacterium]
MQRKGNFILITGFLLILFFFGVIADARYAIYAVTGEPDHSYWVSEASSEAEAHYTAGLPGKFAFLEWNGFTHRLLGQREMNHVIKLNNGYLAELQAQIPPDDVVRRAHMLADLEEALWARDVAFLYLAAPTKISAREENLLPAGARDYSDENLDRFMNVLAERGVNRIDLRETIRADADNYYDFFYVTDHHWNTEAGFYAYGKIADWLTSCGIAIDPRVRDLSNYTAETFENAHLGSRGRRSGVLFGGIDDFTVYTPRFETELIEPDGTRGDFTRMLMNRAYLSEEHDHHMSDTYDSVLEPSTGNYVNPLAGNDATVLFVSDSMGFAVAPYLAISAHRMISVNAYEPWNLASLVEETDPDAVVVLHASIMNLIADESFRFGY